MARKPKRVNYEGLKPCPFCGSDQVTMWDNPGSYSVQCDYCSATMHIGEPLERAAKNWNRRAGEMQKEEEKC